MSSRFRLRYDAAIEKLIRSYSHLVEIDDKDEVHSQSAEVESNPNAGVTAREEQKAEVEAAERTNEVVAISSDPDQQQSSSSAVLARDSVVGSQPSKVKSSSCLGESCQKKAQGDCIHKMCFLCCYSARKADGKDCSTHYAQTIEREREDRYIEEGLAKKTKKSKLPFFYEDRFTDSEQTVVIWCFKDFVLNKKWSEECFNQELRKERQKTLLQRRQYWRATGKERNPGVSRLRVIHPATRKSRRARANARYVQHVRAQWNEFAVGEQPKADN